jgi:hypothetical protein
VIDDLQFYSVELDATQVAGLFADPGSTAFDSGAGAPFAVTAIEVDAAIGDVTLTWNSQAGKTYLVEYFDEPGPWRDGPDSIPSQGQSTTATVSGNLGIDDRLFRVVEEN